MLIPLVNQFGMMQQQMMDQFQQTISMLVQMFGSLHRDQMDLIRQELDQLRDLTKEFQTIKVELAELSRGTGSGELAELSAAPGRVTGPSVAQGLGERKPTRDSPVGAAGTQAAPASSNGPQTNGSRAQSARHGPVQEADRASGSDAKPSNLTGEESQDTDRDVIVWLHQRMMTLQQQRETRWQKILKLLPGLS